MLLNELLIKIGIDTDSDAFAQLNTFVEQVGNSAEQAVDFLGNFADTAENVSQTVSERLGDVQVELPDTPLIRKPLSSG
ncbi:hypothetical protein A4G19_15925 [Pasteurellaceae bacterium Macca]|nr:hypothetical protein [Pasteurellaceae bacterium Macca]